HLSPAELRLLSITLNRLGETGRWDEEALRTEFAELIDLGEDVVVSGFEAAEIDFLLLDDESDNGAGELDPAAVAEAAVSRPGDLWLLGRHRLLQADARDPASYERLMLPGEQARLVLTDEPYNVPNVGHVTSQARHREFAMAAGEMSREEFGAFNRAWMSSAAPYVVDGGLIGTLIDWRSVELVLACGRDLGFDLINIVVWSKPIRAEARTKLLAAIARARRWLEDLISGRAASIETIAVREGVSERSARMALS